GDEFIISGESGAVPLGTLYSILTEPNAKDLIGSLKLDSTSQVFFINTEGNTDPMHFRQIIWDGCDPVPKKYYTQR
ncbi:MAG: diaminopropionate ammonia-lyase, partial [Sphaerochaetaceae bacterium]